MKVGKGYQLGQAGSLFKCSKTGGIFMTTLVDFKNNTEKIFEIAENNELTPSEINMLLVINLLSDNEKAICFASNKTLAQKVNLSANRVSYVLKCLAQKRLIILNYAPKGRIININGKDYINYRFIKLNLPLIADDNTPLIADDNPPLSQTITNKTKNNKTKNNKTNLSSKTMDNNVKKKQKVKSKKKLQREIKTKHKKLFKYAMELIKNRKSVGNKKAYALTIVINWLKAGLNTVEKVEEDKAKHSQIKSNHVFIEKVPSCINAKGTKTNEKVDPQIYADIDRLMAKLCN